MSSTVLGCAFRIRLELGEDLLDWIEIRAVGGQEDEVCSSHADGFSGWFAFVGTEIVEDDDVTIGQSWNKNLFDIGGEDVPVDRSVDHPRGIDAVMAQGTDENECFPVPVRYACVQSLSARAPAAQGCHIGLDPCLVEEDEASGVNPALVGFPARSFAGDIRT